MRRLKDVIGLAVIIMVFAFSATSALAQADSQANTGKAESKVAEKVNINKATVEELMAIKGIGESYAERIVEYREKNGPFQKIEDIMQVKGIGEKKFETIKDLIGV